MLVFLTALLLLSACSPLLTQEVQLALSEVQIDNIPERVGQKLKQSLQYKFQSNSCNKNYALKIILTEQTYSIEIGLDAKSKLVHVTLKADYQLKRIKDQKLIGKGAVTANNYRALTTSYYSCTTADRAIQDNNIKQLVYAITNAIASLLKKSLAEIK